MKEEKETSKEKEAFKAHLNAGRSNQQRSEDSAKRKKVFFAAYGEWGTIRKACEVAGIARHTYATWYGTDPDFVKEFGLVRQAFAESLEELALDRVRNPDKNRGSDVLLIGLLNANMPQKYRPQFNMSEDAAKDLIIEWRKAAKTVQEKGPDAELPVKVEDTLQEILERRGNVPAKEEEERK